MKTATVSRAERDALLAKTKKHSEAPVKEFRTIVPDTKCKICLGTGRIKARLGVWVCHCMAKQFPKTTTSVISLRVEYVVEEK